MEKTYNGAVMALPQTDEELFARINERTARRRAEQEAAEREMYLYSDEQPEEEISRVEIRRALPWIAAVLMSVAALLLGRMM